jgi:CAAX protease family protein
VINPIESCPKSIEDPADTTDNNLSVNTDEQKDSVAKPWGFWITICFSFIVLLVLIITQTVIAIIFAVVKIVQSGEKPDPKEIELLLVNATSNGLFVFVAACVSTILCVGLILLFVFLRKGITFREYLSLKIINGKEALKWSLILLLFVICQDIVSFLIGKPIVTESMLKAYQTCLFPPFLFFAVVVAAPILEEFFFRGFLFVGIQNSKLGAWGAAIITSILWAGLHLQYDMYGITHIFIIGLLLSYAKLKTGSLYTCIMMHSLMNIIAFFEIIVKLKMF